MSTTKSQFSNHRVAWVNRPGLGRKVLSLQLVTLTLLLAQAATASAATFAKATYNGLFSEMNGTNAVVNQLSSGFITLLVRESGAFSGALYTGAGTSPANVKNSLHGQFDADGRDTLTISRTARLGGPLTVELQYAPSGQPDMVTGQVSGTNWTAQLLAYPAYSSQPPQAGRHTFSFQTPAADQGPEGIGAGAVVVSLTGRLVFSGKLPDGTRFTQSLYLCKGGHWPVYASLYRGQGSVVGWVEFDGAYGPSGAIGWSKTAMSNSKYYPQGVTNVVDVLGLAYTPPRSGSRPLNFKKGLVVFSGGGLSTPFTNEVTLSASGRVNANTRSRLKFKINPRTGQFTGTAEVPGFRANVPVSGAVFQSPLNQGYGYFLGNGQSGAVLLYGDYR